MRVLSMFVARISLRSGTKLFLHNPCKQCMYFEPRNHPFTDRLSKCRRFGEFEPETRQVTYEYADLCRKNEHKCGPTGKYFEKK
jgi:hypothetical protein